MFGLVLVLFFAGVMPLVLMWAIPATKARMRRMEAQQGGLGPTDPAVLDEIDALRQRMGELEERLDFTERMLARQQESQQLPGGER